MSFDTTYQKKIQTKSHVECDNVICATPAKYRWRVDILTCNRICIRGQVCEPTQLHEIYVKLLKAISMDNSSKSHKRLLNSEMGHGVSFAYTPLHVYSVKDLIEYLLYMYTP